MAIIHSCYGMHCPWENSRGDCTWKKGTPAPCQREEMTDEEIAVAIEKMRAR